MSAADQLTTGTADERIAAMSALRAANRPLTVDEQAALFELLGHDRKRVQRTAAETIAAAAAHDATIADRLEALTRAPGQRLRWGSVFALSVMDRLTPAALDVLLEAMGENDGDIRWAAANLVTRVRTMNPAMVDQRLLTTAEQGSPEQRKMALYCLRDLGVCAAADVATRATESPEVAVRLAGLSALVRLTESPASVAPRIVRLLDDPDVRVQRAAAATLGPLGVVSSEVVDALERVLQGNDPSLQRAAKRSLALLGRPTL